MLHAGHLMLHDHCHGETDVAGTVVCNMCEMEPAYFCATSAQLLCNICAREQATSKGVVDSCAVGGAGCVAGGGGSSPAGLWQSECSLPERALPGRQQPPAAQHPHGAGAGQPAGAEGHRACQPGHPSAPLTHMHLTHSQTWCPALMCSLTVLRYLLCAPTPGHKLAY